LRQAWEARAQWSIQGAAAAVSARARYRRDDYLQIIQTSLPGE
jgi:hypothetical protein